MIKERKINEVFMDSENFTPAKRLKCVEGDYCNQCVYNLISPCDSGIACTPISRYDGKDVYFIETNEPLKDDKLCHEN